MDLTFVRRWLGIWLVGLGLAAEGWSEPAGAGRFVFAEWSGPAIPVWTDVPAKIGPETKVVFVMHGVGRNASEYRDQWLGPARAEGFLLLVPEFSAEAFPGVANYNFGGVFAADGTRRPKEVWAYTAIDGIFAEARRRYGVPAERYAIYGHSAGAQFVHRMMYFRPDARVERWVVANAGAYLQPRFDRDLPYGLGGSGLTEDDVARTLALPVIILLGDADSDPNHRSLPSADGAREQGRHRFSRGLHFVRQASELAAERGWPLGWRLRTVPDVGHDNERMAPAAAAALAGR